MMCDWYSLLAVLPQHLRKEVDRLGKTAMQELRLRINAPPELILMDRQALLSELVTSDDLQFVINAASRYSPWSVASISQGYLSIPGGHRIGICGTAVIKHNTVTGIRDVQSLCIRVARDFTDTMNEELLTGSILILGAPGWGKTTLLRNLARKRACSQRVAVVDERGELFPEGFLRGRRMDVLTGCPKTAGIEMLLRTMGPECIAADEITAEEDCQALLRAANCGVSLLATAHASSAADFRNRKIYRPLLEQQIIDTLVILRMDKTYYTERIMI